MSSKPSGVNANTERANGVGTPKERGAQLRNLRAPRFLIKRFNKDTGMKIKPRKQNVEEDNLQELSKETLQSATHQLWRRADHLRIAAGSTDIHQVKKSLEDRAKHYNRAGHVAADKSMNGRGVKVGATPRLQRPAKPVINDETINELSAEKLKSYIDKAADYVYPQPNMRVRGGEPVYANSISQVRRHGRGIMKAAEHLKGKQLLRDQKPVTESKADDSAKLAAAVASFKGNVKHIPTGERNVSEKDFFRAMYTGKKIVGGAPDASAPRKRAYDVNRPSRGGVPKPKGVSLAKVSLRSEENLDEVVHKITNPVMPRKERSVFNPSQGKTTPTVAANVIKKKIESVVPSGPGISREDNAHLARSYLQRTIGRVAGGKLANPLHPDHVYAAAIHNEFEGAVKAKTYPSSARHKVRGIAKKLGADEVHTKNIHTAMHAGATGEHLHIGLAREHLHRQTAAAELPSEARDVIHNKFENGPAKDNTGTKALAFASQARHEIEHHQELARTSKPANMDATTSSYMNSPSTRVSHDLNSKVGRDLRVARTNLATDRPTSAQPRNAPIRPQATFKALNVKGATFDRPNNPFADKSDTKAPKYDVGRGEPVDKFAKKIFTDFSATQNHPRSHDIAAHERHASYHEDQAKVHHTAGEHMLGAMHDAAAGMHSGVVHALKTDNPKAQTFSGHARSMTRVANAASRGMNEEEVQEVLSTGASAGEWIHDFVHSSNPRFQGKSDSERIKMALGAYYAKHHDEDFAGPGGGPDLAQPLLGSATGGSQEEQMAQHLGLIDHHGKMSDWHAARGQESAMLLHDIAKWGHKHALTALRDNLESMESQSRKANRGSAAANAASKKLTETTGPDTNVDSLVPSTQPGLTRPDYSVDANFGAVNV